MEDIEQALKEDIIIKRKSKKKLIIIGSTLLLVIIITIIVLIVLLNESPVKPNPDYNEKSFITEQITIGNGEFLINGEIFSVMGATDYSRIDGSFNYMFKSISDVKNQGFNTIRMVEMFAAEYHSNSTTSYKNLQLWQNVDYMIYVAKNLGLKIILDLATFKAFFFHHGIDPYGKSTYPLWAEIVDYMTERTNIYTEVKYKDEPAIFCFSIMGEPVVYSTEDKFDPSNEFSSRSPLVVSDSILYVAQRLKEKAPNILVQSGGLLHFPRDDKLKINGLYYWEYLLKSKYIDFFSIHLYPDQTKLFDEKNKVIEENTDQWINLKEYYELSKKYKKPLLVEEFGYNKGLESSSNEQLINYFTYCYNLMDKIGIHNAIFWNWGYEGGFDISPRYNSTMSLLKSYMDKWKVKGGEVENPYQPEFYEDEIKGEVVLQSFSDYKGNLEPSGFVKEIKIEEGVVEFEINCEKNFETVWYGFDIFSGVDFKGYDYLAMDVFVEGELDELYVMIGTDFNGYKKRFCQTSEDAKNNYSVHGEWIIAYVKLAGGMSNAMTTVWQKTKEGIKEGEVNRVDITVFNGTSKGKGKLKIRNIRLLKVNE